MPATPSARERLVNRLEHVTSADGQTVYVSPWLDPDEPIAAYNGRVYVIVRSLPTPRGPITVALDNIFNEFLQHTEFWFDAYDDGERVHVSGVYIGRVLSDPVPADCRAPWRGSFSSYFATRQAWVYGKKS